MRPRRSTVGSAQDPTRTPSPSCTAVATGTFDTTAPLMCGSSRTSGKRCLFFTGAVHTTSPLTSCSSRTSGERCLFFSAARVLFRGDHCVAATGSTTAVAISSGCRGSDCGSQLIFFAFVVWLQVISVDGRHKFRQFGLAEPLHKGRNRQDHGWIVLPKTVHQFQLQCRACDQRTMPVYAHGHMRTDTHTIEHVTGPTTCKSNCPGAHCSKNTNARKRSHNIFNGLHAHRRKYVEPKSRSYMPVKTRSSCRRLATTWR